MPELGNKYECAECGTKFYDLGNPAAVCPKCGTAPKRDGTEVRAQGSASPSSRRRRRQRKKSSSCPTTTPSRKSREEIEEEVVDAADDE